MKYENGKMAKILLRSKHFFLIYSAKEDIVVPIVSRKYLEN